jgi:hypothetical protein
MVGLFKVAFILGLLVGLTFADVNYQIPSPLTNTLQFENDLGFASLTMSGGSNLNQLFGSDNSNQATGSLQDCDFHYWRLDASQWASDLTAADYLHVNISSEVTTPTVIVSPNTVANFTLYVRYTTDGNSLAELPNADLYDYKLSVSSVFTYSLTDNWLEIPPCQVRDTGFYWFAVGEEPEQTALYRFTVSRRRAPGLLTDGVPISGSQISELTFGEDFAVSNDTRPAIGAFSTPFPSFGVSTNQAQQNLFQQWRYFSFTYSEADFAPGAFIVVNISRVTSHSRNPAVFDDSGAVGVVRLALNYETVPYIGTFLDSDFGLFDGQNACITLEACDCSDPCVVTPGEYCSMAGVWADDYGLTASLTVYPHNLNFGTYYVGVLLPTAHFDALLTPSYIYFETSYTLRVDLIKPVVEPLPVGGAPVVGNAPLSNFDYYEVADYYTFTVDSLSEGQNLRVELTNIHDADSNGRSLTLVVRALDNTAQTYPDYTLRGLQHGLVENCEADCVDYEDASCSSCEECRIVIAWCNLAVDTTYYVAVFPNGETPVASPISYHISAELYADPEPVPFSAGIPVFGSLGYSEYNFWELTVPELEATSLYVELFVNHFKSEVSVQMLYNSTPGEICYLPGDFQCRSDTSCYFYVDSCLLHPGTYYFSVFAAGVSAEQYEGSTDYTFWVDFDNSWELKNNVTYTDSVRPGVYNHYHFLAENVIEGSWFTVEVDNIDGGTVNAYVNYQHLAGECPCYASFVNCTGNTPDLDCTGEDNACHDEEAVAEIEWNNNGGASDRCCKLELDGCAFRDGIWYISVRSDLQPINGPISHTNSLTGYTITAIVHPPPPVFSLTLNRPTVDWVDPEQINHYRLIGDYAAEEGNLVVKVTWMQDNCGRNIINPPHLAYRFNDFVDYPVQQLTEGDVHTQLTLRINHGHLALPECFDYPFSCKANSMSHSSCEVIVPYCVWSKWDDDTFVSVAYDFVESGDYAQFTLRASVEVEPVTDIVPGVHYRGIVGEDRYVHYVLDVNPLIQNNYRLELDVYFNVDRTVTSPQLLIQVNSPAGGARNSPVCEDCQTYELTCNDENYCHFDLDPCDIAKIGGGEWFITLFGTRDYYAVAGEFTLTANFVPAVTTLVVDGPRTTYTTFNNYFECKDNILQRSQSTNDVYYVTRHFRVVLPDLDAFGSYYHVEFSEFASNYGDDESVSAYVYLNKDAQAGLCDCYSYLDLKTAVVPQGCASNAVYYDFKLCEGFTGGVYYFSVYTFGTYAEAINFQVEVTTVIPEEARPFGTITNTDANGLIFHLGADTSLLYLQELSDDIDAWIIWNTANERFDQEIFFQNVYYTFMFAAANQQVLFALYDVAYPDCKYDTTLDLHFVGAYDVATTYCVPLTEDNRLCSSVGPGADVNGSRVSCFGAIDRCLTNQATTYAIAISPSSTQYINDDFAWNSYVYQGTFSLKLFTQTPVVLSSTSTTSSNRLNVTYFFNEVQEFELTGMSTTGNAPMAQIVFRDIAQDLTIYLRPAPLAGNPRRCPLPENCYDEQCVEVRGGFPISNAVFFDAAVNANLKPTFNELTSFGAIQCSAGQDCTISLLPCALLGSSDTWYMAVYFDGDTGIQTATDNGANVYQLYWNTLTDRRTTTNTFEITQAQIDSRERFPGPEFCSDTGCPTTTPSNELSTAVSEMDNFIFYFFDVDEEYTQRIFNGTKDNSKYTQVEVQLYGVDLASVTVGPAIWIAHIAYGETPTIPAAINDVPLPATVNSCCGASYTCYNADCADLQNHFVIAPCCLRPGRVWVTVRLLTPGTFGFRIRVRFVEQQFDNAVLAQFIDSAQFGNSALTPSTFTSLINGDTNVASGVEPNNYIHYYTTISQSQINAGESLVFNISIDELSTDEPNGNTVFLYVRRAAPAGRGYDPDLNIANYDHCLGSTYSCSVLTDDSNCVIDIPNSQLFADDWYFSVYQDGWFADFESGLTDPTQAPQGSVAPRNPFYNNLGFEINIFFRPAAYVINAASNNVVLLSATEVCSNHSEGGIAPGASGTNGGGTTLHYLVQITQNAIDSCFGSASASAECFYENTLVIEVVSDDTTAIPSYVTLSSPNFVTTSLVPIQLSGQPGSNSSAHFPSNSYSQKPQSLNIGSDTGVATGSLFFSTFSACNSDFDLVAGDYYLSITVSQYRSFSICAHVTNVDHDALINPTNIVDLDDETQSVLIGSRSYLNNRAITTDDQANFFYKFTVTDAQADDQLNYLQFEVTNINDCTDAGQQTCTDIGPALPGSFEVTVFYNEGCESWENDAYQTYQIDPVGTRALQNFYETVIDEAGLVLCTLRSGTYRIHIQNNNFYDFTLNVYLRHALTAPLSFDAPTYSQIWQNQYHVYSLDVTDTAGAWVTAILGGVSCGTLEMWAKYGSPAGPLYDLGCPECAQYYSNPVTQGNEGFINIDDLFGGVDQQATWFFTVHTVEQSNNIAGFQIDPVSYYISVFQTSFDFITATTTGCPVQVAYDVPASCPITDYTVNQQYVFQYELSTLFSTARLAYHAFGGELYQSLLTNETVHFQDDEISAVVAQNDYVSYSFGIVDNSDDYEAPLQGPTTFNTFVRAPLGSIITLTRDQPFVPTIVPLVHYHSSIAEDQLQFYKLTALGHEYNALHFTTALGQISIAFLQWEDYFSQITVIQTSDLHQPEFSPVWIPEGSIYLVFGGDQASCSNPCRAIEYSFWYVNYILHDTIECNHFRCDSVGDLDYGEYHIYDVESFDPLVGFVVDTNWTTTVQTVILNGLNDNDAHSDIEHYFSFQTPGLSSTENFPYASEPNPSFCRFDDFTVVTPYEQDQICISDEFRYQIEYQCTPLTVWDITSPTLGSGFDSGCRNGLQVYSLDLSGVSLEFAHLDISFTVLAGSPALYKNFEILADNYCHTEFCTLQNGIYFFTVRANSDDYWQFRAQLVVANSFPLTLGVSSDLIGFNADQNYQIYHVDVNDFEVDDYLQFELIGYTAGVYSFAAHFGQIPSFFIQNLALPSRTCACPYDNVVATLATDSATTNAALDTVDAIIASHCDLTTGRYYLWIQAPSCLETHFRIRPVLVSHQIAILPILTTSVALGFHNYNPEFNFYSFDAGASAGQVRLSHVSGGYLDLTIRPGKLPSGIWVSSNGGYPDHNMAGLTPYQGHRPVSPCGCLGQYSCTTGFDVGLNPFFDNLNDGCVSCSLLVADCVWASQTWYISVSPAAVPTIDYYLPINYVLTATDETFTVLNPSSALVSFEQDAPASPRAAFAAGNWQHFLYSFSSDTSVLSVTLEIHVEGDAPQDGVFVTLSTDPCFTAGHLLKNVWCSAEYDSWVCELQIPTRAEHTGATQYYVDVYGRRGSFSLTYVAGWDNCAVPADLAFCAPYVDYHSWDLENNAQLDDEASCRYQDLYAAFIRTDNDCSEVCWKGISDECDDHLKRFSCYESFPPCDQNGFLTSTCTQFCDLVESTCSIAFSSVGYQQYDCQSTQYIDVTAATCAGSDQVDHSGFDF